MTNNSRAFAFVALAICVFLSGASRSAEQNAASAAEDEFLCEPVADDSNAVSIVKFTPSNNPQGESLDLVVPSELQGKKVVAIGARAFYNCDSLSSITLPEGVTTIGEYAFARCDSLSSITLPESVTTIGVWAFEWCGSLSSISLPESVTTIDYGAFDNCNSLRSISVSSANASYKDLDGVLCSKDGSLLIAYPSGRDAKDYVVPSGVTTIGGHAFWSCDSLSSISLPEGVTTIGDYAFAYCRSLSSISLPESVTTIGDGAFWYCGSLSSISLPESVTTIGKKAFEDCDSLTSISVSSANASYKDLDGVLCSKDGSRLIAYPSGRAAKDYVVPSGVTTIGENAFWCCRSLSSISLPEGVTTIGARAFLRCGSLRSISLPESVTTIGENAFYRCDSLTSISVSSANASYKDLDGVLYAKDGTRLIAYPSGRDAKDYVVPSGVTTIGDGAFFECGSLRSISLPEGLKEIGEEAFAGCGSLSSITLPEGVTTIGEYAFAGCDSLSSISLPESVTRIGYRAFEGCSSDLTIVAPPGSYAARWAKSNDVRREAPPKR